jgi:4-carboxymuconolactone decarboxylase
MHDSNDTVTKLFGRLTPAENGPLEPAQRAMADQLHKRAVPFAVQAGFRPTDDHDWLIGPWNVQVHRPELAQGYNAWVAADQSNSTLLPEVREVAILACAVTAQSRYEIYAHSAAALTAGISAEVVDALRTGAETRELTAEQDVARTFASQLTRSFTVTQATYDRAQHVLGEIGVIDLTYLVAIYIATAALLGAFAIESPDEAPTD